MKSWCKTLIACGLSLSVLTACSSNDVEEEPAAPLKELQASVFPEVSWSVSVGNGVGSFYSQLSPAVRYGKVFVAGRFGEVAAFDENTGDQVWSRDFSEVFRSAALAKNKGARLSGGITAARNKVFIGGESGMLGALDAETGELAWYALTSGEVLSAPTVAEDIVVVHTGIGTIEAYDVESGKQVWTNENQLPNLTLRGTGSPAYESGGFFVGSADGKVSVIIKSNGQTAWQQPIYTPTGGNEFTRMADVDMKPVIVGQNLYAVSYNGNLVAMEMRSGRIIWSRKYSSFNELAVSGLSLFVVDDYSRIYAVDKRNGLELWSNSELINRNLTSAAVFGEYVVVGDFEGYLHFIARESGKIEGRLKIDDSGLYSQPVVVADKLYVQTRAGKVATVTLP